MKKVVISKKDLKNNIQLAQSELTGKDDNGNKVKLIAVVKANGMGLDLIEYSKFLIKNGIKHLAVATVDEAVKLRQAEIKEEILMLSPVILEKELKELIDNNITLTLDSPEQIELCEKISNGQTINAHIKIDTGFGRYGFVYTEKSKIIEASEKVYNAEFNINPKQLKGKNIGCEYCKYKDICYMKHDNIEKLD